jgi:hypothetical protein
VTKIRDKPGFRGRPSRAGGTLRETGRDPAPDTARRGANPAPSVTAA